MEQNWISIISFTDQHEASIVHSMLDSEGIKAVIEDKASIQNYSEAFMHGSIKVYVEQGQVEKAAKLLIEKGYDIGNSETAFEKKLSNFLLQLKERFSWFK